MEQKSVCWHGILFLFLLVVTGSAAVFAVLTPLFLLVSLSRIFLNTRNPIFRKIYDLYRQASHTVQWMWMGLVVMLIKNLFQTQFLFFGDESTKENEKKMKSERAFWLSNHRTRIDWMLLWSLAFEIGILGQLKIVLKDTLRKIPVFGWAMQHFLFIFLRRNWDEDKKQLSSLLPFLGSYESDSSYLFFPEGSDLSERNVEKSNAFAKSRNLEPRKYTLHPRTNGFTFIFDKVHSKLDALYDITMLYIDHTNGERPSEVSLLSGRMPRAVYFYIERVPLDSLESEIGNNERMSTSIESKFQRKESILKTFYEEAHQLPKDAKPLFNEVTSSKSWLVLSHWAGIIVFSWILLIIAGRHIALMYTMGVSIAYILSTSFFNGADGAIIRMHQE
uniref:Lysocardiolipin acyltransferase putative n=1 Tax=Albugo laibachii Nc14 TaxID=890382 RepID=F0X0J0_9STRA|nr:lysocardiolipin acyltransferase putative [Albugo laibachii Nc14]|eukprot:CCA27281.1 lysocardiolipin acyltransferase putative [Albugo laibachii Nc14]